MTVQDFLSKNTAKLQRAGISTARLDCLVLLEDALGRNRASLLAHLDDVIEPAKIATLNNFITQRITHRPLAYIRGHAAFYGRDFNVNQHVLIPRPETESIIEIVKKLPVNCPLVVDVGCGSGCIGITIKLELPGSNVTLTDLDQQALKVAKANAKNLGAAVYFTQADLLEGYDKPVHLILANLPYVPDEYPINKAAGYEPKLALFAGADGLDLYRRLWSQIKNLHHQPEYVIIESLMEQHDQLKDMAKAAGYKTLQTDGLVQLFART